jgi:hypothetical protein
MRKRYELTRKSLSVKKPNEMRSILLKGFEYAQLLGSQPNKVSADNPEFKFNILFYL